VYRSVVFAFIMMLATEALTGCGGGGGGGASPNPSVTSTASPQSVTLSETLSLSQVASTSRRSTESVSVGSVDVKIYVGTSVSGTPSDTSCSNVSGSSVALSVVAPVGTDTAVITAYVGPCAPASGGAGAVGSGTVLAQFQGTGTVTAGSSNLNLFNGGTTIALVSPSGTVYVNQSSFSLTQSGQTATLNASENGFSGNFSAVSSAPSVASVSPSSGTAFTITAGSTAGTATITVSDGLGNSAQVTVGVTLTSGTIQ
jgi:hypothetical protein